MAIKTINTKQVNIPRWASNSLQGLVFYIGHELCQYHLYHLGEESIVRETTKHIQNTINNLGITSREVMYKNLGPELKQMGTKRADLVLYKDEILNSVIEIKKAEASPNKIKADLERLVKVKDALPFVRCFLIVVSQKNRPTDYVTDKGYARKKPIKLGNFFASTIRVFKATSSFKKIESAHYACLIEVHKSKLEPIKIIQP